MERISTFDFSNEQTTDEQVRGAVGALLAEGGLLLPDFVRAQMEESILRAVEQPTAGQAVQLNVHFNEADIQAALSARWGFFQVQRKEGPRLFLDVYLYQE